MKKSIRSHKNIIWAPIRHHSPQCSRQLIKLLNANIHIDRVLIEGPDDANHLLPTLCQASDKNSAATLPLALYLYAIEEIKKTPSSPSPRQQASQKHNTRYRCYVPFSSMSPEWNAISWAHKNDVAVEFIDMPYDLQLTYQQGKKQEKSSDQLYYDDSHIIQTDPINHLVNRSGCRDFNEWWDQHFETGVDYPEPEKFFDNILSYSLLLKRYLGSDSELMARDTYMAEKIRPYIDAGESCIVVCGGFHCDGISEILHKEKQSIPMTTRSTKTGVYLIPYSLSRLNSASGYAAGIPDCGYYHQLWTNLNNTSTVNPKRHDMHALMSHKLYEGFKSEGYPVTTPDAIEAVLISQRLADIRNIHPGRPELKDAIATSFIKDYSNESQQFHQHLNQLLQGNIIGSLPKHSPVPPIVSDFRQKCEIHKCPQSRNEALKKTLDIYRKQNHRAQSRFLHQLDFLQVPYAYFQSGPQFSTGKDIQRVRENWKIQWCVETEAHLIENAHFGESIHGAALNKLLDELSSSTRPGHRKVELLVQALAMGLHDNLDPVINVISDWLRYESAIPALAHGLMHLNIAYYARTALDARKLDALKNLMEACFTRICARLPWVIPATEEELDQICQAIIDMHSMILAAIGDETADEKADLFHDALYQLRQEEPEIKISGICTGVLLVSGKESLKQTRAAFVHAFRYCDLAPENLGEFLWGFLSIAKSHFIQESAIQKLVSEAISGFDENTFLHILPSMRLAFMHLNPREKLQLGKNLFQKTDIRQTFKASNWQVQDLHDALALRQELDSVLNLWGMQNNDK